MTEQELADRGNAIISNFKNDVRAIDALAEHYGLSFSAAYRSINRRHDQLLAELLTKYLDERKPE